MVDSAGMPLRFHILLGVLLALHIALRFQAQKRLVDPEGRPVPFRWWRLRIHAASSYAGPDGALYRNLTIWSALVFMVTAVILMLLSYET